jgi:hypothetical protein
MVLLWLFAVALLLFAWGFRERYVDMNTPVKSRPSMEDASWRSKIDAQAPIGGEDADYIRVLQAFYDKVYVPATKKPTDKDVAVFLQTADAQVPGVDPNALKKIIATGFRIQQTETAAAREQKEIVTTGALTGFKGENLQPKDGVDQVYVRKESIYTPVDSRIGDLPEGVYETTSQFEPRNPGELPYKYVNKATQSLYSVCTDENAPCFENVL